MTEACVVDEAELVEFVVKVTNAGPVNLGMPPRQVFWFIDDVFTSKLVEYGLQR